MGGPRTRKKTGDAAKEVEKGKKEKNCNNEVDAQAKKKKREDNANRYLTHVRSRLFAAKQGRDSGQ
jgi:hypothetical protein